MFASQFTVPTLLLYSRFLLLDIQTGSYRFSAKPKQVIHVEMQLFRGELGNSNLSQNLAPAIIIKAKF